MLSLDLAITGASLCQRHTGAPPFTAIGADGWQASVAAPTDLSFAAATILRAGFTPSGAVTVHTDTVRLTKRVRRPYPDHASFTADKVALSDYVLASDTIAGATNASTLTSPRPIAAWVCPAHLTVAATLHWELVAFHYFGIACVKVRASDGTSHTAWQSVAAPTLSSLCEDRQPLAVYQGDLDVSALANGAIWLEAEVYPRVGGGESVLRSEDNHTAGVGRECFTRRWYRHDALRIAGFHRVYVSSTGSDATGVASTNDATAAASPCLTVGGALAALRTAAGAVRGSFDNAHIFVVDGVNVGTVPYTTHFQDVGAVVITRAPTSARSAAVLTINANLRPLFSDHSPGVVEGALLFRDVTVRTASGFYLMGEAANPLWCQFWDCDLYVNGALNWGNLWANSVGSFYGARQIDAGSAWLGQATFPRLARGVEADLAENSYSLWVVVSSLYRRTGFAQTAFNVSADGQIIFDNRFIDPDPGSAPITIRHTTSGADIGGFAVVQNLVERVRHSATPSIAVCSDSTFGHVTHGILAFNTTPSGRHNLIYDEHPSVARNHRFFRMTGELGWQFNTKGDELLSNGARTGNFAFEHGVGCEGNFSAMPDVAGATNGPFSQFWPGIGSVIAGGPALYTDDQSDPPGAGDGAGNGTYSLQAGSPARNRVAAANPLVPVIDLAGTSRGAGVQNAGAYA